jgi:hypothetical protein
MAKEIKRGELEVGKEYYLIFDRNTNEFSCKAEFVRRIDGGLYFKPLEEQHCFATIPKQDDLIGFLDMDGLEGFYEIENE